MAAVYRPFVGAMYESVPVQVDVPTSGTEVAAVLLQAAVKAGATRHVASAIAAALLHTLCEQTSKLCGYLVERTSIVGAAL